MTAAPDFGPVRGLHAAVSGLLAADYSSFAEDDLLAVLRNVEVELRRLAAVDHAVVAEVDARGLAREHGVRDTTTLLRRTLRVTAGEARARVAAARDLGPRRDLSGQPLEPVFPVVAAAQVDGVVSARHAAVIVSLIERLPDAVQATDGAEVEATMVEHAAVFDPAQLAVLARRHEAHLNPDGQLSDDRDHERRRHARLRRLDDGSGELTAHLTPAALAVWQAVLDPLAAPVPAADGTPDPRTPGQRLHDGLLDAGHRLLRSDLPHTGGAPTTVLITMTLEQLESRLGLATTGHGGTLSISAALTLAVEADIVPVVLDASSGVLSYGRTRRTATPWQRRALAARDGGCSFPGCDIPAAWTQAHHVREWSDGGPTDLANLTLICGYHHRSFTAQGWTCRMTDGAPEWLPPPWIDPQRRPLRTRHRRPEFVSAGRS